MRTWLLHFDESPVGCRAHSTRDDSLAQSLARHGHHVLRWTASTPFAGEQRVEVNRNYSVQVIGSPVVQSHFEGARLLAERVSSRRLRIRMGREAAPNLIVAALPSLDWAVAAIDYGRAHRVPVVIDVRQRWPDAWLQTVPAIARAPLRAVLRPYREMTRRICREADSLVGTSPEYLDWALEVAGRSLGTQDVVVPLGYEKSEIAAELLDSPATEFMARGIDPQQPSCLFAGELDRNYDLDTLIDAAGRLHDIGRRQLQFLLCGDGPRRNSLERRVRRLNLKNVHFLGRVNDATLEAAAAISNIGLCPYAESASPGLPRELFDFMAHRLAVVSSLTGDTAAFLKRHECGITYDLGSINALTNAINRLVVNPLLLESLRNHGQAAWRDLYRCHDVYGRLVEHLDSLARFRRAA